jgi:hypothetical protein
MEILLTRVGRAAAMGLAWAFFWVPVVALASATVVGELELEHIGGPLYTGFACGAIFSALAGLASGRRTLERLSLREAAVLGAAAELGSIGAVGAMDPARLNPNGGAIALGHPIGATGARLVVTLVHELERAREQFGLASLCVGGGQGSAIVLERTS